MKSTFSVLFFLKNSSRRDGLHSIITRITINGRATSFNSQQSIEPSKWDQKSQRVIGRTPATNSMNLVLGVIKAELIAKYNYHHILRKEPVNAHRLKNLYLGTDTKPSELLAYFDCFNVTQVKIVGKGIAQSTHSKYTLTRKRLSSFLQAQYKIEDIPMERINLDFIMNFERYLRDEFQMCNNSVEKLMRIFRQIVMLAVFNGLLTLDPFKHYKIRLERVERHYLTQEELDWIINKKFTIQRMQRVKDLFLFCCYTSYDYSTTAALTDKELVMDDDGHEWIDTHHIKTGTASKVKLLDIPLAILKKYELRRDGNYLLPVMSNAKYNLYLKEIASTCGIEKNVTSHVVWHTFSTTIALNNGMPIETLSKILGHTNIKSTLVYAKVVDQKLIDDMERLAMKIG